LRDAQVLPIWEGTTNILSLDVLRAADREGALQPLMDDCQQLLTDCEANVQRAGLETSYQKATSALRQLVSYGRQLSDLHPDNVQAGARVFALGLARTYSAALLIQHAVWSAKHEGDAAAARIAAARRWCRKPLVRLCSTDESGLSETAALAMT